MPPKQAAKKVSQESNTAEEGRKFVESLGKSKRRAIKRHPLPEKGVKKRAAKDKDVQKKAKEAKAKDTKKDKDEKAKALKKASTMKETASEAQKILEKDPPGDTSKTGYKPFEGSYKD